MDMNYDNRLVIMDVRKELEFENGHVQTAVNIPLHTMMDVVMSNIEDNDDHSLCWRIMAHNAASIIKKTGFHNIRNILKGPQQLNWYRKCRWLQPKKC